MTVKTIETITKCLRDIVDVLDAEVTGGATASVGKTENTSSTKRAGMTSKKKQQEDLEGAYTKDQLDAMKYNDLKKLGASLGVKCVGTRDEITERILVTVTGGSEEDGGEKETESSNVVPLKDRKPAKPGKTRKKKDQKPEPEDDVDEESMQTAMEVMDEYDLEDIIEVLVDSGVKLTAKQKKDESAILHKLAGAISEGLVDLSEEDNTGEDSGTEFEADSYFSQYDPEGYNDPSSMSDERAGAVQEVVQGILDDYNAGELNTEDIEKQLEDIVTEEDTKLLGKKYTEEELLAFYIEMMKRFVDDDGEMAEPGDAYELNEENFCCGHELRYAKKTGKYVCEVCGEEYEE